MTLSPEILSDYRLWAGALFVAVVVSATPSRLRRPKEKTFICTRCRQEEAHNLQERSKRGAMVSERISVDRAIRHG
jgi:hypothetical protein